jgi:pimeloyl-ACP methyl ester carboxylesterase
MMGPLFGVLVIVIGLIGLAAFIRWRSQLVAQIYRGTQIAETSRGPVEYTRVGVGPVLLHLHGGATGCDQTLALSWDFHEVGFTILTPSRPGYLRTPLTSGATPEEAADAVASLLDVLGIHQVGILGTSGGGPTALQFVLRHPKRVWGVVLQSAVTQQFVEPRRSTHSLLGWVVFSRSGRWLADLGAWGIAFLVRCWPSLLVRSFLNASEDLDQSKARERRTYVLRHPEQLGLFCRLARSGLPLSVRQAGIWNDLHQYAQLPVYPLEQITCPTLVIQGRADGNVPFAHAEFVARTVRHAELYAIEDCGHLIWVGPGAARAREKVLGFLRLQAPPATHTAPSEAAVGFSAKPADALDLRGMMGSHES